MPYEHILHRVNQLIQQNTSTSNNTTGSSSVNGNMSSNTYDFISVDRAEGAAALQPACIGYDEAGRMTSLTTFRAGTETVSTDPSERTDGDTTLVVDHCRLGRPRNP